MLVLVPFLTGCGASSDSRVTAGYQAGTSGAMVEPARVGVVNITGSIVPPAAADTTGSAYKIGPLDVLEVSVFKVPELSRSVQVAEAGTVNLPLVGEIPAAGRTAQEVERDLTRQLGAKYLQKPQVTVYIKEYNSQRVTVEGAVKKPGVFPFQGRGTLLQSIAMAEGLDTTRASTDVVVFRVADGRRRAAKFDVEAIRAGHVVDPALQAGDVVVVHDSSAKIAFNNILRILPAGGAFVGLF
jgi:polysaccharide export outer membrane protein